MQCKKFLKEDIGGCLLLRLHQKASVCIDSSLCINSNLDELSNKYHMYWYLYIFHTSIGQFAVSKVGCFLPLKVGFFILNLSSMSQTIGGSIVYNHPTIE